MKKLGYRDGTRVEVKSAGIDRYELYVAGKTIGIWGQPEEDICGLIAVVGYQVKPSGVAHKEGKEAYEYEIDTESRIRFV